MGRKFKEYPKIIYPEGKDPVRVKSFEEAMEILGDEDLINRIPGKQVQSQAAPEDPNDLKCRYCGKKYLPMHKKHLSAHEANCDMNPENKNANRERDS